MLTSAFILIDVRPH